MNKKETYQWIKKVKSNFDWSIPTREAAVNEVGSTCYLHEKVIFDICHYAKKYLIRPWIGIDFCEQSNPDIFSIFTMSDDSMIDAEALVFTEVRSLDRKHRADILLIYPKELRKIIVEVAVTEEQSKLDKKRIYWEGKGFEFIEVRL